MEPGVDLRRGDRLRSGGDLLDLLVGGVRGLDGGADVHGDVVAAPALKSWLFRVASNESARLWRSKAAAEKMYQKQGGMELPVLDPTSAAMQVEATQQLKKALKQLPESWQQIVSLRIYENLTFQQIADQLGIPLGTALTRMRRALERLRKDISQ